MSLPSPINFLPLAHIVPCEPYTFTFKYTETDEQHVKGETNIFSAWVGNATSGTSLQTLTNGGVVYPGYWQLDWNPVKASEGEYFLAAAVLSSSNVTYTTNSQLFNIEAGSDESCIDVADTTAAISLVLSSDAIVAPVTSTGQSASSTAVPAFGSLSTDRTQLSRGAVAGLVIGIIAILFGLLAAILFVRRRRAARAQKAQVPALPTYVPALPAYATVVPVGPPMAEMDKKDMDSKSELGPPSDYDRTSMRSVPPSYHPGDV